MKTVPLFLSAALGALGALSAPVIVTDGLPVGTEMVPYSAALSATNGPAPFLWSEAKEVVAWGGGLDSLVTITGAADGAAAIAAGYNHHLALRPDGTVAAWGDNTYGQTNVPPGLNNVTAIAAGYRFSLALRANGTVAAWGDNSYGQTNIPPGLSNVTAISTSDSHSLALQAGGTVVAWGDGWSGQTNVPPGLSNVIAVAAGGLHSLALRSDGTVVAWGNNSDGQTNVPAALSGVTALSAGAYHNLALKADGTVAAWGYSWIATVPDGLNGITAIDGGTDRNLALRSRLPDGLSLSPAGVLSGTPQQSGTNTVILCVRDNSGGFAQRIFDLVISQTAPPDEDGDGLPDPWEVATGLRTDGRHGASDDPDGDGHTNLQEFRAGTDPLDAASQLVILGGPKRPGPSPFFIEFFSVPGRRYQVLMTANLTNPNGWLPASDIVTATGDRTVLTASPPGPAAAYYKVVVFYP